MRNSPQAHQSPMQPRNWPIAQLPGLSHQDQSNLLQCGITTTGQLIGKANTPAQRQALANRLAIQVQSVNKWVAMAHLASIPSVGCQYCGLLLHAGVGSVPQLAGQQIHRLHQQILRLQIATMQRRDLCPSVDEVARWIQQARSL